MSVSAPTHFRREPRCGSDKGADGSTLWTWITQRVVQVQSDIYRAGLGEMSSLKGMIVLEMQ